ncbi:MAG: D-glycero-beta-D-manno-heptose 1-phosphate adenylyltransferase [Phycisphaerae bacterium]
MAARLVEIVRNLPASRVVLVGDLMVDRYMYGNAERLSPEAPVPVLHFQHEELRLGGAGGVAANLAALGAKVAVVGGIGDDATAGEVRRLLREIGCDTDGLVCCQDRPTTCKMRLVGSAQHRHPQQMIRMDYENRQPLPDDMAEAVVANTLNAMEGAAVVCIEDYDKGVLRPDVIQRIIEAANQRGIPTLVDPAKLSNYDRYRSATCLKLNRPETEAATGLPCRGPADWPAAAEHLLKQLNLQVAVITLDKSGAYLATAEGEHQHFATKPRQVYDVTGAGDMVLATLAVSRAAGASWGEALMLSNVAGGLEVERFGAIPVTPDEIIEELLADLHDDLGKERTLEDLLVDVERHRAAGRRIVFTNGCFDLVHLGHVKYFQFAKRQGDVLIVGVNTDGSIRRLKGEKRPVIHEDDRVGVLEELESIDYLVKFDDDTPLRLIEAIRPDVLVKGADYAKEQVVGWELVEAAGGRVALAPLIEGRSTSGVIGRIVEAYK